jgi:hypothetical protein
MEKERKFDGIWNAERVLCNVLYYANDRGFISYEDSKQDIRRQRFYAAFRAYGKIEEKQFENSLFGNYWVIDPYLWLSKTRSEKKMEELRRLLKDNLSYRTIKMKVDSPDFLEGNYELVCIFQTFLNYRMELLKLERIWSGVLECNMPIGIAINATTFLYRNHITPACKIIDRILVLLMGDDFDKTFTEEELFQYGYPDVTDEELYQMESEIEW